MASANWAKATTQKAGAMKKHLDQDAREKLNHSNKDIDKSLTYLSYTLGCKDYSESMNNMKARTAEVDKLIPPKRIRKDRVTCCFIELPCPAQIRDSGQSDDFFRQAFELMQSFFGKENVHGGFVHKDEVHEYTDKDGERRESLEHMHTLVSAYTKEKGINGKAFETKGRLKAFNKALDDMCMDVFHMRYNTGEKPDRKSVERLKAETQLREEISTLKEEKHQAETENEQAQTELKETVGKIEKVNKIDNVTVGKVLFNQNKVIVDKAVFKRGQAALKREVAFGKNESKYKSQVETLKKENADLQAQADKYKPKMSIKQLNENAKKIDRNYDAKRYIEATGQTEAFNAWKHERSTSRNNYRS